MNKHEKNDKKLSVIMAAYNEAPRIAKVLEPLSKSSLVSEIIVVNDGSTDNTAEVVEKFDNVRLINNEHNLGKTLSVKKGIASAKGDIIALIDADLVDLKPEHIDQLAEPVLSGEVDWTLSLRENSGSIMKWLGVDWVSGERVIPKKFLDDPTIWKCAHIGYGLETLMNYSLLKKRTSLRSVYLKGLKITSKMSKVGFWNGLKGEIKMVLQIIKICPYHMPLIQFFQMAYLNKKYSK